MPPTIHLSGLFLSCTEFSFLWGEGPLAHCPQGQPGTSNWAHGAWPNKAKRGSLPTLSHLVALDTLGGASRAPQSGFSWVWGCGVSLGRALSLVYLRVVNTPHFQEGVAGGIRGFLSVLPSGRLSPQFLLQQYNHCGRGIFLSPDTICPHGESKPTSPFSRT